MSNRTWVFRSDNGGADWESRGVMASGAKTFGLSGVPLNMADIDADGAYLFLALLNGSGQPQILKLRANLLEDGISSFNPGDGTEVNVMAGDLSGYWIWAAGDFGATDKVVRSTDRGAFWYVMNDWSDSLAAHPILVGPGDDMLVTTSNGLTLQQTRVEGDSFYWIDRATLNFGVWAIDRLDENVDNLVVGAYWYSGLNQLVNHSANSGLQWADLTLALPDAIITSVVAGHYAS